MAVFHADIVRRGEAEIALQQHGTEGDLEAFVNGGEEMLCLAPLWWIIEHEHPFDLGILGPGGEQAHLVLDKVQPPIKRHDDRKFRCARHGAKLHHLAADPFGEPFLVHRLHSRSQHMVEGWRQIAEAHIHATEKLANCCHTTGHRGGDIAIADLVAMRLRFNVDTRIWLDRLG